MIDFAKRCILILALMMAPGLAHAQAEPAAEAPVAETAPVEGEAEAPAAGSYERMKPTPGKGMPVAGGIDFQDQYSPNGEQAVWINHTILIPLITVISVFVLGLLLWVVARYNRRANPDPSRTTHNTFLEVVWTLVPVLILVVIAVPSISLIAKQYQPAPEEALTVKVTGYQWYWGYSYPDNGGFEVISNMLSEEDAEANGEPYQLAVDNRMVIPAGKPVKLLITAADVIHSFAVPSAYFKLDAVPGKINEKVLQIDEPGVYYGQCSELCGVRHGFMPIAIEVLPEAQFNQWVLSKGGSLGDEPEAAEAEEAADAETETAANDNEEEAAPVEGMGN